MFSLFCRVTKVTRHHNGVKVMVENGNTYVADAAVIAIPLGVLKANTIKFEPKLPDWKEEAISNLGVGIENKIILHFEKVFWPNVEFLGVVSETSYGCSYFLNLHKATGHPVLVYMPAGKLARDIEKMSDEAAAGFAFKQLKTILPDASDPVCSQLLVLVFIYSVWLNCSYFFVVPSFWLPQILNKCWVFSCGLCRFIIWFLIGAPI